MITNPYDENYYERGNELGISCYSYYRWMPELTIPMAYTIIRHLGIKIDDEILDFGCAKGYLVHALRLLHHTAWGYDISQYAVSKAIEGAKPYISNLWSNKRYDWVITKDVLEHVPYEELDSVLLRLVSAAPRVFCVVPLGEDGKYVVPAFDLDKTHMIRENAGWWCEKFRKAGFGKVSYQYHVQHLKENYATWEKGNCFLIAEIS